MTTFGGRIFRVQLEIVISSTIYYHIMDLKDHYFVKVQLRRLEISEYIPGFSDCVDGITEKKILHVFLIRENSEIKDPV
jgi:hypothetical protein